jgi:anti-sigma28 factor (negative regulator of flagellin synthesis)
VPWKEDMGISKIGSLFASNLDSVSAASPAKPAQSTQQQQASPKADSLGTDAVVFSRSMGSSPPPSDAADAARAARVQALKKDVERGAYRTDSGKVAVAVLKELS